MINIFLRSDRNKELYCTEENWPKVPDAESYKKDYFPFFGPLKQYESKLRMIIESSVKVGNVIRTGNHYFIDGGKDYSPEIHESDTPYQLEGYKRTYKCCISPDGKTTKDCAGPHCENHKDFLAILSRVQPKEEGWETSWEKINNFEQFAIKKGYSDYRSPEHTAGKIGFVEGCGYMWNHYVTDLLAENARLKEEIVRLNSK